MQTHRDAFSGVFLTYPMRQRTTEKIQDSMHHFSPAKPGEAVVRKGGNAKEALAALRALRWRHDPSLPTTRCMDATRGRGRRFYGGLTSFHLAYVCFQKRGL